MPPTTLNSEEPNISLAFVNLWTRKPPTKVPRIAETKAIIGGIKTCIISSPQTLKRNSTRSLLPLFQNMREALRSTINCYWLQYQRRPGYNRLPWFHIDPQSLRWFNILFNYLF